MVKSIKDNKRRAVSPIVAVLILIVVAVVGGGAVAVLMGQIGSQTAQQASTQATKTNAATTISIGGSTIVYPITEAIKQNFTQATGIQINDQQGGSGAGLVGVAQGVLDIGAVSSLSTFHNGQAKFSSANLQDFVFAGSGIVLIDGSTLTDGANTCKIITKSALKEIYGAPGALSFKIAAGACAGPGVLEDTGNANITTTTTHDPAPAYHQYLRADLPAGVVDTFMGYVGLADPSPGGDNLGGTIQGNQGEFNAVKNDPQGFGFVDIASNENSAKVATLDQPGISSANTQTAAQTTTQDPYVAAGGNDKPTENNIKAALAAGSTSSPNAFYPDSSGNLSIYLMYVTAGAPSSDVQKFFDFIGSPIAKTQINNLGYFTPYDWKGAGL